MSDDTHTLHIRSDTMKQAASHNPVAKSFAAGINKPQVVPNKKRDRRACRRPFTIGEE